MKNVKQSQPILLSGVNLTPLSISSNSQVDIAISDRSHRWLLIDKLCFEVDARASLNFNRDVLPSDVWELIAALYEVKIDTKLVSITEEWIPLLMLSQMLSSMAESEPFVGVQVTAVTDPPANLTMLEWVLPRPLLLRPGEALRFSFRQSAVNSIAGLTNENAAYTDIPFVNPGALFNVTAKGTIVRVDAKMTKSRQVPYIVAQTFDARDVVGGVSTGANANKMTKVLENKTNKILRMHSMLGRWLSWNTQDVLGMTRMFNPGENTYHHPLVSIVDYAGYDVCKRVPLQTVFPPQVCGSLRFEGVMQPRDVLKLTLERDPRDTETEPLFFSERQAMVALTGWREEAL